MTRASRLSIASMLAELRLIRHLYAPECAAEKLALLRALADIRPTRLHQLVQWHEDLLFLRAFPDDGSVHEEAGAHLRKVERMFRRLPAAERAAADDSGIAGSTSRHTFAWPVARWLVEVYPREAELDWPGITDLEPLSALIRVILQRAEEDAFESGEWTIRQWIDLVRGPLPASDLGWLVSRGSVRGRAAQTFGGMYESAAVQVRWSLAGSAASVTHNAVPRTPVHFRRGMRHVAASPVRHVGTPLTTLVLLDPTRSREMIDVARAALATRCREVSAISSANPGEVWLADLGEGTSLAIIGTSPATRLSIEANYGYLLLSNGVPIGYGGVTTLFRQANTGINIFEPFRHGEAAFAWTQILRAFHSLFGVKRFVVNAYQFGEANDEAISSGAFWFYYRAGFRPVNPAVRRLAATEEKHRTANPRYRSLPATLLRLASGDMHLTLPGFKRSDFFEESWLPVVAARAARRIAAEPTRSSDAACARIARSVALALGAQSARWPVHERAAFVRMAPVVAQIPALNRWPARERRALISLIRAKGEPQEREFVRLSHAHPRFFRELIALARRGRIDSSPP